MRRLFIGRDGSVSVYLIMILVPIFLLNAIFIDVLRIRLAGREADRAMKSGLRSLFSAFDPELHKYGLYGLLWDGEREMEWDRVVDANLTGGQELAGFRMTDTTWSAGKSVLRPVHTLAEPEVYKKQVMDDMKYAGPVEFALEIADKFKQPGNTSALTSISGFYKDAERLEELAERREHALDLAWSKLDQVRYAARAADNYSSGELAKLEELAGRIGLVSLSDAEQALAGIERRLGDAGRSLDDLQSSLAGARSKLAELSGKETDKTDKSLSELSGSISAIEANIASVSRSIQELDAKRREWKQVLADMAEYTARFYTSQAAVTGYELQIRGDVADFTVAWNNAEALHREWTEEIDMLRRKQRDGLGLPDALFAEGLLYGPEYFTFYLTGAGKLAAAYHGIADRFAALRLWNGGGISGVRSDLTAFSGQQALLQSRCSQDEARRAQRQADRTRTRAQEEQTIASVLAGARLGITTCGSAGASDGGYNRLTGSSGLYVKYREAGVNSTAGPETGTAAPSGNAREAVKQSVGMLDRILELASDLGDRVLIQEYALTHFNYRTSGIRLSSGTIRSRSDPESHRLPKQEAEYVLYGGSSCSANQGLAYGEMFLVIFGIRTAEALSKPGTSILQAGSPLLAFLAAAAQGAVQAAADMAKLTDGQSIPLFKGWRQVTVNYKDLLRLFMLLHGNESAMLARMQALTELNTGIDLKQAVTYVEGTGSSSVRLWFLSGAIRAAKLVGTNLQGEGGGLGMKTRLVYSYD